MPMVLAINNYYAILGMGTYKLVVHIIGGIMPYKG
jgi:hypothetical protein